jgi:hypothetical protein
MATNDEDVTVTSPPFERLLYELFKDTTRPPSHEELEIAMPALINALWRDLGSHPAYDLLVEMVAKEEKR